MGMCAYTGSLDNRLRELVTVTVLTVLSALPQLKAHVGASLNAGCTRWKSGRPSTSARRLSAFQKHKRHKRHERGVCRKRHRAALPSQKTLTGEGEDERYRKGLEIQAPLYGTEIADRYTWLPGEFAQAVPRFLTELCFGDFYTRTGWTERPRELLTVVLLAALGGAEAQVKSHVQGALKAGCTKEEVVCTLVHAGGYMGIPRLFNALNACKELL